MGDHTLGHLVNELAVSIGDGYRTKQSELGSHGFRILRVADLHDWSVGLDGTDFVRAEYQKSIGSKLSRAGDVLLTTKGTVGRVAIFPDISERVAYSPQLSFIRVLRPEIVHNRFLAYWLKSQQFTQQLADLSNSTDMAPYLSLRDLRSITVTLPNSRVQKSIAKVLGALDDKIAANGKTVEKVSELAAALFDRAVANVNGPSTTISTLSAAGDVIFGDGYRTNKNQLSTSGFGIIRAADVQGGVVRISDEDFVSSEFERQIGGKSARAGDVVVTTKGTVGRVAVVTALVAPAVYSPQCCYFRVPDSSPLSWGFLAGWLLSRPFNEQLKSLMHKSDMAPYVNLKDVGSLTLRVPDQTVQRQIDSEQRTLLGMSQKLVAESADLGRTRNELLPLLMTGKISVKDAESQAADFL